MIQEKPSIHRMSATDRQRQLLETALTVFSRKGFKGATTKEIASVAGVTEAIIFQHFSSKEALYSAVLELNLDTGDEQKWIGEILDYMERKDDEGLIYSFILRILQGYRRNAALQRVILFAALEGHEQGLMRLHQQFSPIFEKLKGYISLRQKERAFIGIDPYAILIAFGGIAHQYGLITQIMKAPAPDLSDENIARQFTRIFLCGIRNGSTQNMGVHDNPDS